MRAWPLALLLAGCANGPIALTVNISSKLNVVDGLVLVVGYGETKEVLDLDPGVTPSEPGTARIALTGSDYALVSATVTGTGKDGLTYAASGATSCPDPCSIDLAIGIDPRGP